MRFPSGGRSIIHCGMMRPYPTTMIASGASRSKLPAKFLVVLDLVRLADLQSQLQRPAASPAKARVPCPGPGACPVGSRPEARKTGLHQLFESRHGKGRRAAENEIERSRASDVRPQTQIAVRVDVRGLTPDACVPYHSPAFISLRILRFMKSRLSALMWLM